MSDARAGQRETTGWRQDTPLAEEQPNSPSITSRDPNEGTLPLFSSSSSTSRARTMRQQGYLPFSPPSFSPTSDVTAAAITSGAAAPAADTDPKEENDDDAFADEPTVLPFFTPACVPSIRWGNLDGDDFCDAITSANNEAVHWQRNIFLTPSDTEGKELIQEMARLFQAYAGGSAMESFALTAAMTMPLHFLQKPQRSSKTKDHVACLKRRLTVWKSGDIDALVRECRAIQASLRVSRNARIKASTEFEDSVIRGFTKLMLLGNVRGALQVLSQAPSGGIHPLQAQLDVNGEQRSVLDILQDKHWPPGGLVTSLTNCFRLCNSRRINNKSANRGAGLI